MTDRLRCYWCLRLRLGQRLAITIRDGTAVCEKHLDGPERRNNY